MRSNDPVRASASQAQAPPRIQYLRVQNYRALKSVELKDLTPLTVLLGPNGSGKSTLFDVFSFLSECFQQGLRSAWDRRGRAKELRSREAAGPIVFELKYRERRGLPLIIYHLAIDEGDRGPFVVEEWLQWTRGQRGRPFRFLEYRAGQGRVVSGEMPDEQDERKEETLDSPEMVAVNTLGRFARHPRVSALRRFITGWYLSYLSADETRGLPETGHGRDIGGARTTRHRPQALPLCQSPHPEPGRGLGSHRQ